MKRVAILFLALVAFNLDAQARVTRAWSDGELEQASDLVVVGRPIRVKDLDETNSLGWDQSESFRPRFRGVETTFKVSEVLKGTTPDDEIVLHHYREALEWGNPPNGPTFLNFNPNSTNKYLLYLIKDGASRYAPVAGQIDTGDSIRPATNRFPLINRQEGVAVLQRDFGGTYAKKLKNPWSEMKVVLYRASGEKVQLDAKAAVYTLWPTRNGTNFGHGIEFPVSAFVDPATKYVWVGWAAPGNVETNEFNSLNRLVVTNYVTHTNFYLQTDSGIVSGDSLLSDGAFIWSASLINRARPGEKLDSVIDRFEKHSRGSWPWCQRVWRNNFRSSFRENFFSSNNFGAQETPIQSVAVANGQLRLNFNSLEYRTKGSVWLDLKTFRLRQAVEDGKF